MAKSRVLVIDADASCRDSMVKTLGEQGAEVTATRSCEDAIAALAATAFELVVTEWDLPGAMPAEWLRRLRDGAAAPDVLVVASRDDAKTAAEALRLDASDYLLKPVAPEQFARSVRRALDRRRSRTERERLLDENLDYLSALALYERAISLLDVPSLEPLAERLIEALCLEARAQSGVLWVARDDDPARLRLSAMRGLTRARDETEEISLADLPREIARLEDRDSASWRSPHDAGRLFVPLRHAGRVVALARLGDPLSEDGFASRERTAAERLAALVAQGVAQALRAREIERGALRDPALGTYSMAYLEDVARREVDRAARTSRSVSLVELRIEEPRRASPLERATRMDLMTAGIARCLRASDLLASDGRGRIRLLLPETDALGAAVLKRRACELVQGLGGAAARESGVAIAVVTASFPTDGRTFETLERAISTRLDETRSSLLDSLGIAEGSLPEAFDALAERGAVVASELPDQVMCFALAEVARHPEERGMLFVSPGRNLPVPVREALERLRGLEVRTDVIVLAEQWPEALAETPVTCVSPRRCGTRHPFVVRFGEGPSFALVRAGAEAHGTNVFQTADRPLVEHLAFALQRELAVSVNP